MYSFFKPITKPSAAAASTSEAPATAPTLPSTSSLPKQSPLSAASAPPHVVNDLNGDAPSQPLLASYPKQAFGATSLSFNRAWYRTHLWLEYSVLLDASSVTNVGNMPLPMKGMLF